LIFKNQAMNQPDKSGQFVNDLLRTEFHKFAFVLCSVKCVVLISILQKIHGEIYQGKLIIIVIHSVELISDFISQ